MLNISASEITSNFSNQFGDGCVPYEDSQYFYFSTLHYDEGLDLGMLRVFKMEVETGNIDFVSEGTASDSSTDYEYKLNDG